MKDVTSTSFGLIIGFLLPGLAALLAVAPWSPAIASAFAKVQDAKTDLGLSVLGLMAALTAGLIVTLVRWLIFEKLICRRYCVGTEQFKQLGTSSDKLPAFRAAVDEHYRYHQFWGGIAVVAPLAYATWLAPVWKSFPAQRFWVVTIPLFLLQSLVFWGAIVAFQQYVGRSLKILKGT